MELNRRCVEILSFLWTLEHSEQLTLGAGHLWVPMFPWRMSQRWNDIWNGSYISELRIWNQVKLWSSQLWTQFLQLRREAWKIHDFNGVWTRDLTIPVRRSNQLSYEATDVGSRSFVGSNVPVRNESTMKWSMKWIIYQWTAGFKPCWSHEFFRLLYAIAKIALISARIIASLDFVSAVHWYMMHFIDHFIVNNRITVTCHKIIQNQ